MIAIRRAAIATATILLAVAAGTAAAAPAGSIVDIKGRGEYRQAAALDWRPAVVKQPIFINDYVRSLHQSYVTVLFSDGTQEKIGPNGQMNVRSVAEEGKKGATILELLFGRFWFRSKTVPERFEVRTPSASASVRGTEWQLDVGKDGDATLSVYAGEVEFFNEQGRLLVRANEQARAERGRAPVKLQVRVSRERMQWVSAATVDPQAYVEFRDSRAGNLAGMEELLKEQRVGDAAEVLRRSLDAARPQAVAFLLQSDFQVYAGDLDAATAILQRGAALYAMDERFDVGLARLAMLRDDPGAARRHVESALAKRADSPDALVALADLERLEGRAHAALSAYARAARAAPKDARPWRGIGVVESEREDVRAARAGLLRSIELDDAAGTRAELGTLEGFAGDLPRARAELRLALAPEPGNYVALTGLGIVELKAGDIGAALEALLAATAIEPRYARGHVYLAAAYYQAGRDAAALESLRRAMELDGKDPLPHVLAGLIHMDRIEPGAAVEEGREAQRRLPFTKSMNPVADDRKGIASVGAPLGAMGLEAWARSAAHDSYLPFWGASHLFLADRYPGEFDRRAELMQGFIADPIALGGSNRFQTLVQAPGHYAALSMRAAANDDVVLYEPVVTLAGSDATRFPLAYFAEAIDTRVEPRDVAISAHARTITAAVGAKPFHEAALFLYANHLDADEDVGRADVTGIFSRIHSRSDRIDGGARFAPDSRSMLMFKAGAGDERSTLDQATRIVLPGQAIVQQSAFEMRPRTSDAAIRHVWLANDALELSWGAETAAMRNPITLRRDAVLHFEGSPAAQQLLDQHDRDRSDAVHAAARWQEASLRIEAGLAWHHYDKDRGIGVQDAAGPVAVNETYRRDRFDPHLGITWLAGETSRVRAACRRWLRPTALDTLAPIAVAGMALDDQLVLAGGAIDQCRAQAEWTSTRVFAAAFAEHEEVHNFVSPLDGPLNARQDVTNVDRLRNRTLLAQPKPDELEDLAVYGQGRIRRAGAMFEAIVTQRIGARIEYRHTVSENTAADYAGRRIPYLPRHLVAIGATWAPGYRVFASVDAIYRSERFADEANTAALRPGWDGRARIYWETPDKHWSLEAFAANLLKKDVSDAYGIVGSYRF